jgi:hypothetical protein
MTLPTSGQLSINDINALFQRGNKLSDYRGTRWYKDDCSSGYFNSTNLRITDFYGTRPDPPTFSVTVSGANIDLHAYCIARGWNQCSLVYATINAGADVYATSTGSWAIRIEGFTYGIVLTNNAYIAGHGGAGGAGAGENVISRSPAPPNYDYTGENGEGGGPALYIGINNGSVTIYNYGVIGGGGGGGGGGGYMTTYNPSCDYYNEYAGDGGGGGAWFGSGAPGGVAPYSGGSSVDGDPGEPASYVPGAGGHCGAGRFAGGAGGYLGQTGSNGSPGMSLIGDRFGPGYGGPPGWAVLGTNLVNWGAYGTVYGPTGNVYE